jgi:CRISPR/Cas system-associated exonuclease Cas4 (RecB family)
LQYRVRLENRVPQPVSKNAATGDFLSRFSYSATALDTYLACPLRFYYRFVLRVAGRPEVARGIERTDIGNLVHTALADYFGARLGRQLTRRDLDPVEMTQRIRGIMESSFGAEPSGRGYLLMRQVQKRLGDFLALYCGPLVQEVPVGIIEVERKIKAPFRGFLLNGKIDVVQKRGDRTCIIDYKTSSNRNALKILFNRLDPEQRDTWSAIGSLQLPVYRILYAHENKTGRAGIDALFILLGMTQVNEEIEVPLFPKEGGDAETLSAMLDEVIFRLLSEITDPAMPFHSTADWKKNCPICDYTCICGTQWVAR